MDIIPIFILYIFVQLDIYSSCCCHTCRHAHCCHGHHYASYSSFSSPVPVSKPYVIVSDSSPVEGTAVWMRCGLENGTSPIRYAWERENRDGALANLAEGNINLLNITSVSRNHTGWYRCLASNEVNQQRSDRIWLDIICQ